MPDRNLDYAIRARDESAGVFERFRANIASANREARQSGDLQLERFLKGGGVAGIFTLGAEEVKKFGEAADKAFRGILDGTQTWGDALDGVLKNLPVFGQFYQGATTLVNAAEDGAAAFAKWIGASDGLVNALKSVDTQIAEDNERVKVQTALLDALADAQRKFKEAGDDPEQQAKDRIQREASADIDKYKKARDDAVKSLGDKPANPVDPEFTTQKDADAFLKDHPYSSYTITPNPNAEQKKWEDQAAEYNKIYQQAVHTRQAAVFASLAEIDKKEREKMFKDGEAGAAEIERQNDEKQRAWQENQDKLDRAGQEQRDKDLRDAQESTRRNQEEAARQIKQHQEVVNAQKRADDERVEYQKNAELKLQQIRLEGLEKLASTGNSQAKIEAERLRTLISFNQKRAEIEEIANNPNSSFSEKVRANLELNNLASERDQAVANIEGQRRKTAGASQSRFLTGVEGVAEDPVATAVQKNSQAMQEVKAVVAAVHSTLKEFATAAKDDASSIINGAAGLLGFPSR